MKLVIGITAPQSIDLIKGQLEYFVKRGYMVYLLSPVTDQVLTLCKKEQVELIPMRIKSHLNPFYNLVALFQLIKVFLKVKPDIVNLATSRICLLGMMAAKIAGVRLRIYTCHSFRFECEKGIFRKLLIRAEKTISAFSHKVICISLSVKELGIRERIFSEKKTVYIGKGSSNGIDLSLFSPDSIDSQDKKTLKKLYKLDNKFVFGYIGSLIDRKGINELYKAFDSLYKEVPNIKLLVAGTICLNEVHDKTLVKKFRNHPGIIMTKPQPQIDIPLFLSLFDVFVLPAWWEEFGNVLIQAAAMGVPIISTQSPGCKDAVRDRYNGVLIEPKSSELLKEAMYKFYRNPEQIEEFGKNGMTWARNFRPEIIWNGLEKVYQN